MDQSQLHDLKLRGILAVGVRCARRMLPIALLDTTKEPRMLEDALAMADAMAGGETGPLLRAREVAAAVKEDSSAVHRPRPRLPEMGVLQASRAIDYAAQSAVAFLEAISRAPPPNPRLRVIDRWQVG